MMILNQLKNQFSTLHDLIGLIPTNDIIRIINIKINDINMCLEDSSKIDKSKLDLEIYINTFDVFIYYRHTMSLNTRNHTWNQEFSKILGELADLMMKKGEVTVKLVGHKNSDNQLQ